MAWLFVIGVSAGVWLYAVLAVLLRSVAGENACRNYERQLGLWDVSSMRHPELTDVSLISLSGHLPVSIRQLRHASSGS